MDISQYGEDPDSAYGTEVYVQLNIFLIYAEWH